MNILTDKRLKLCADMVTGSFAADIGTDHGYLAAYLVLSGKCEKAIAADINPQPLESARHTVCECGCEDKIQLILSDGLKNIPLEGVTDIVIAGMGGELIAKIIDDCAALKDSYSSINLVLQPMTRPTALREYLYDNGFEIKEEKCVHEGRFVYSVIKAGFTGKAPDYPKDERYIWLGRIDLAEETGREYAKDRIKKLTTAANGMLKSEESKAQGEQLMKTVSRLTEMLQGEKER